jgi:hypothetical protein
MILQWWVIQPGLDDLHISKVSPLDGLPIDDQGSLTSSIGGEAPFPKNPSAFTSIHIDDPYLNPEVSAPSMSHGKYNRPAPQ